MTDYAAGGVIRPAGTDPSDDRAPLNLTTCYVPPGPVLLVTCLSNPQPHELADDCQSVTFLPRRARFCGQPEPHDGHEWYGPALRWNCPGRPEAVAP